MLLLLWQNAMAQEVIGIDRFLTQIEQNHPVAKQADLKIAQSLATVLASKGIFDPQLNYSFDNKKLGGVTYYNYDHTELQMFTPLGVKIKAGVENSAGNFINPEMSKGTYSYLGMELPLLRNLLLDKKRAALQQAEVMVQASEVERRAMLNQLYQEALYDYYSWAAAYMQVSIVRQNLLLAENRLKLTRILWQNGDKSAIDSTEARSQWLSIQLQTEDAMLALERAKINISNYLWNENAEPYLLTDMQIPDTLAFLRIPGIQSLNELISNVNANPELQAYDFKRSNLAIERRLKRQAFLPELNLKLNTLSKNYFSFENTANSYLNENYKIGVGFQIPLFLREARGEFQKIELKIKELDFDQKLKLWDLENKLRTAQKELTTLNEQLEISQELVNNFDSLLSLEELRFREGESSLFVINSRQNKLLETQLKLNDLLKKYQQTWYKQQWAAGLLFTP